MPKPALPHKLQDPPWSLFTSPPFLTHCIYRIPLSVSTTGLQKRLFWPKFISLPNFECWEAHMQFPHVFPHWIVVLSPLIFTSPKESVAFTQQWTSVSMVSPTLGTPFNICLNSQSITQAIRKFYPFQCQKKGKMFPNSFQCQNVSQFPSFALPPPCSGHIFHLDCGGGFLTLPAV